MLLVLFTGLRREEAASLKWDQVGLKAKTLKVLDTKNSEVHTLPLCDYLFELLSKRRAESVGDYVFPGPGSKGYISPNEDFEEGSNDEVLKNELGIKSKETIEKNTE